MWDQMGLFSQPEHPYSVSEITGRIRALLEQEPLLQDVWIEGEISNFSRASSGHIYFTLKDAGAQMNGVVWRSQAQAPSMRSSLPGADRSTRNLSVSRRN
jgi:exodeoxyribonuclease VII large subunit